MNQMIEKLKDSSIISFDLIARCFDYKSGFIDAVSFSITKDSAWYISLHEDRLERDTFLDLLKDDFYYYGRKFWLLFKA